MLQLRRGIRGRAFGEFRLLRRAEAVAARGDI
jgi:hypothetical protein